LGLGLSRPFRTRRCAFRVGLVLCLLHSAFCLSAGAATYDKANNADDLNLTNSWNTGLVPGGADIARFNNVVTMPLNVSLGTNTAWNQLSFNDVGGDLTVSAGHTLTLSNNNPILFGAVTPNLTLDCDLICAGSGFSTLRTPPAGQTLTLNGSLQGREAAITLGNSASTLRLGSPNSVRIGSIVQVNTGGLKLGIGASSVGDPMLSGPLGTNQFTWASALATTELFAYNGDQTLGNPFRIQFGPLVFNSLDDLTFSGVVDLNNGNRTLNVTNSGVLRLTGTISNATGLTKTGPGVLELGGTNVGSWTSGLFVYGGTLRLLNDDMIPEGSGKGRVRMTNSVLDLNGFSDAINGFSDAGSGAWTATIDNAAPNTTSVLTIGDQFTYTLNGNLQNSGLNSKLAVVKVGDGGLILSNANTFSGGLTNASDSEIFLNAPGAAGTGPIVLASPQSELVYSGGGTATWTNDIILAAGTAPVLSAADGSVLEIAGVISGPGLLNRTNTLFQQGLLNFSGDNTFTGGFSLFGGSVMFSHPRAAGVGTLFIGNPTFSGGTIYLLPGINLSGVNAITNAVLVDRDFTIGGTNPIEFAGPFEWGSNSFPRTVNVTNPSTVQISGPITGYGFNKVGQGVLTLNGVCSHNGPSTISVGPLALGPSGEFTGATPILVGGSGLFDVSAVPAFAIKPNQSLRVDNGAVVSGNVTVAGILTNNASFSPAIFSNNLTLAVGSTSVFTVNPFNPTGTNLICLGSLTFGGELIVTSFGAFEAGDQFKLFDFTGNPGSFASITLPTLDPGLAWNTNNLSVDGTISVVSTASPSPQITGPAVVDGTNFVLSVTGGVSNGQFRVLTHTNVTEPVTNWTVLSTNLYEDTGSLTVTNAVDVTEAARYFRIVEP
jgi:autotransporter-associated beta strand protein